MEQAFLVSLTLVTYLSKAPPRHMGLYDMGGVGEGGDIGSAQQADLWSVLWE